MEASVGDVVFFNKFKKTKRRSKKKENLLMPVVAEIAEWSPDLDFLLAIGRRKKKGKYEYYIFSNDMLHSTRLDLADMLNHLCLTKALQDSDK